MPSPETTPTIVRWALALATLAVVLQAAHLAVLPGDPLSGFVAQWADDAITAVAAALCLLRAVLLPKERWAWGCFGAGLSLWAVGAVYYSVAVVELDPQPLTSWADAAFLGMYPLAYAAFVLLARSRIAGLRASMSLDGVMVGLGATAVLAALLLDDIVRTAAEQDGLVSLVKLAFPIGDLGVVGLVIGVLATSGWRLGLTWTLIALGGCAFAATDLAWMHAVARASYTPGTFADIGWYAGPVLFALAAWSPPGRTRTVGHGWHQQGLLPLGCGLSALGLLAYDEVPGIDVNVVAIGCAVATLVIVTVRLALMLRENARLLAQSERLAHTDTLTGLANRRQLVIDLDGLFDTGAHGALALFDLNGFKSYNDTFGHLAGDELLARLGRRLHTAVGAGGRAYRMGGDEFCVLLRECGPSAPAELRSLAGALSESGEAFAVTCAMGTVELPGDAASASDALRAADKRMYADKRGDRTSATTQTTEVLIRTMNVRDSALGWHVGRVAGLAVHVGRRLGMTAADVGDVKLAAELHDIGKVAIPDAILTKPGPLSDEEWRFMHQHTTIGEHILEGAPALARLAPIVRASHERIDGTGYPDGLAGDAIPLAARIILACDAYDAMTDPRPYNKAIPVADALAELRRCAGTQFDPEVVQALTEVVQRGATGAGQPGVATAAVELQH